MNSKIYIYIYIYNIYIYRERDGERVTLTINEILTIKLIYLQIKHPQLIFPKFLLKLK